MTFDLRLNQKEATEMGFLTMFVSNLGIMIIPILAALLEGNDVAAHIISIKVDNISAKLEILFEIAKHNEDKDDLAKAVMAEKSDILGAVALRNALAHSLFVFDKDTGKPAIYKNLLTDRRGKPKAVPLDADEIKRVCAALDVAIIRILKAGEDRIKDPFDGHLVLPSS